MQDTHESECLWRQSIALVLISALIGASTITSILIAIGGQWQLLDDSMELQIWTLSKQQGLEGSTGINQGNNDHHPNTSFRQPSHHPSPRSRRYQVWDARLAARW